jgi:hypothetical protein
MKGSIPQDSRKFSSFKKTKSVIPEKTREEISKDEDYKVCMLYGHHGHECDGRLTKEHAVIIGGKSSQIKSLIISLCAKGHDVDQFQDSHNMNKELNQWVAYSRTSDDVIKQMCGDLPSTPETFSKARSHLQRKKYLVEKYGVWNQKVCEKKDPVIEEKKLWYPVPKHLENLIDRSIAFHKKAEGIMYSKFQMIEKMIKDYDQVNEEILDKEKINYEIVGLAVKQ